MHFVTLFNRPRDRLKLKAKYNDTKYYTMK